MTPSICEGGVFRDLTEEELYPEPNVWYCAECGTEFSPSEYLPDECICPTCGRRMTR